MQTNYWCDCHSGIVLEIGENQSFGQNRWRDNGDGCRRPTQRRRRVQNRDIFWNHEVVVVIDWYFVLFVEKWNRFVEMNQALCERNRQSSRSARSHCKRNFRDRSNLPWYNDERTFWWGWRSFSFQHGYFRRQKGSARRCILIFAHGKGNRQHKFESIQNCQP